MIAEVEAPHHLKNRTPLQRGGFIWSFMFFLFGGARKEHFDDVPLITSGTLRQGPAGRPSGQG